MVTFKTSSMVVVLYQNDCMYEANSRFSMETLHMEAHVYLYTVREVNTIRYVDDVVMF